MAEGLDLEAVRSALVGRPVLSRRRTIGEDDLGIISSLTWAVSELHTNKELMRDHEHADRLFPGPALVGVVVGLHRASAEQSALMAAAGVRLGPMLKFVARYAGPVLVGDEIEAVTKVVSLETREAAMTLEDSALNQRGEVVLFMERVHRVEPTSSTP